VTLRDRFRRIRAWLVRLDRHPGVRAFKITLKTAAVILAVAVVVTLTVDMGPVARQYAERGASAYLERPVTIGRIALHVARGRVVVEDLVIAGRADGDRPFFTAGRISVALDWSRVARRRPEFVVTSVEITDWDMLVEEFGNGSNFPRFVRGDREPSTGPRRFTTTTRSIHAWRGRFAFEDHKARWGVVAPNIDLTISNEPTYGGEATFHGGIITIQDFVPMSASMKARFRIDGPRLLMDRIDLETDGARSVVRGEIELNRWPEQRYAVQSRVQFSRMRELFFAGESWRLSGESDFDGTFHLFRGGHELAGRFLSAEAGVNAYRFPALQGSLRWTRRFFEVTDAGAGFLGGTARFGFAIRPLGAPERPTATFDASYADVDVAAVSDFYELEGLRFAGRATGRNVLQWPMGRFSERRGEGHLAVSPPPGVAIMSADLDRRADGDVVEWGPFGPVTLPRHLPMTGDLTYRFDPDRITIDSGTFATEKTHVRFSGFTDWGEAARLPFHVTSRDFQESDQVLAGILTSFGSRTRPVAFGGHGEFVGEMTGPFRRPRVEGTFTGDGLRAWDTYWGGGSARAVIENGYVTITNGVIRHEGSEIRADGLFSLGYPRRDGGDEIDARFRVASRDLVSLRHAFGLDAYPLDGRLSGEFHLAGAYEAPIGFGAMTIDDGEAYGEPFERATSALRFDGTGVRLDAVEIAHRDGRMTGAAFVGWDGTYSFSAESRQLPVDQLAAFAYPRVQPTGSLEFTAAGAGTLDVPRFDVRFRITDLAVGGEPVGQVTGTLGRRGAEVITEMDIASPRLAVTATGRMSVGQTPDADVTFRFHDSSLDPYVRLFVPQLSPFTTASASGTVRVAGDPSSLESVRVDATVDALDLRLFEFAIANAGAIRLSLDRQVVRVNRLELTGDRTRLAITGSVALADERVALRASGDASLGILQGFFPDVRGSGDARLEAAIDGPLYQPQFSGSALVVNGRVRHLSMPNSLEDINGAIAFDSRGIRLDDLVATLGGGRVQFGGRVDFEGYLPGELSITAQGEGMQLRYPESVRSVVDADLSVRGNVRAPTLGGVVTVRNATWTRRVDPTAELLSLAGGGSPTPALIDAPTPVNVRYDLSIVAPSTLRIENNLARLVASADLQLRGTYDAPLLFGRAEIERGEITFEGRRYLVTRGAFDFTNPTRIEPFFDVEAETRVRVPGQTYRVIISAAGTMARLSPQVSSDPPLPPADVVALLFSDVRRPEDAELRALQNPNERETDILAARATQLLANPVSSEVGRVVEQAFGVDAFQLTPSLIDPYAQSATSRVSPSARVTIGKRISDRVYLTFSRSLSTSTNDQILLLEYDESDRLSWILSLNEDETYALEVRVRHVF
jgi:hypothetical protein